MTTISARIETKLEALRHSTARKILRSVTAVIGGVSLAASALVVPVFVGSSPSGDAETLTIPAPEAPDAAETPTPKSSAVVQAPERPSAVESASAPSPADAQPARQFTGTGGLRTALLIGINEPRGSTPLQGAVTDVRNVNQALLHYGFSPNDITMLTEEQATIGRIRTELDRFAARSRPDGVAVFAWAGHSGRGRNGNTFATYNGERFGVSELGASLSRVRSRMWVILPTCYSAGYEVPGVVGPGRVAVFSSSSDEQTWEMGSAGTHVIINMVKEGMIEGRADDSVEEAFDYARRTLQEERPDRVPSMNDQVKGNLDLAAPKQAPTPNTDPAPVEEEPAPKPQPQPEPSSTPPPAQEEEEEEEEEPSVFCGVLGC